MKFDYKSDDLTKSDRIPDVRHQDADKMMPKPRHFPCSGILLTCGLVGAVVVGLCLWLPTKGTAVDNGETSTNTVTPSRQEPTPVQQVEAPVQSQNTERQDEFTLEQEAGSSQQTAVAALPAETPSQPETVAVSGAGPKKVGLCIGLNEVNPQVYPNAADMKLRGCCADAERFAALLDKIGYSVKVLKDNEANVSNVERSLNAAAEQLSSGDTFALLISGHGGRHELNDGKKHENWVLYDGHVWDEDIVAAFSRFKKGVRILVVNDQCHSGGVFLEKQMSEQPRRRYWSASTKDLSWSAEKAVASPDFPQLIQFASSRAEQPSRDSADGGFWTKALIKSFVKNPEVTFSAWFNTAFTSIPRGLQEPQWVEWGPVSQEFREGRVYEGAVESADAQAEQAADEERS